MDNSKGEGTSDPGAASGSIAADGGGGGPGDVHVPPVSFFVAFCRATSAADRLVLVQRHLRVEHYLTNPRSRLWVDFCFNVVIFAVEDALFNEKQTMALLQLCNNTFMFATAPLKPLIGDQLVARASGQQEFASLEATFEFFRREMQLLHTPQQQKDTAFSSLQLNEIVNFMTSTFFRLFAAYQFAFCHIPVCYDRELAVVVETPLPATPLASGKLADLP